MSDISDKMGRVETQVFTQFKHEFLFVTDENDKEKRLKLLKLVACLFTPNANNPSVYTNPAHQCLNEPDKITKKSR